MQIFNPSCLLHPYYPQQLLPLQTPHTSYPIYSRPWTFTSKLLRHDPRHPLFRQSTGIRELREKGGEEGAEDNDWEKAEGQNRS